MPENLKLVPLGRDHAGARRRVRRRGGAPGVCRLRRGGGLQHRLRLRGGTPVRDMEVRIGGERMVQLWGGGLVRADLEISAAAEHYRRASAFLAAQAEPGPGSLDGRARRQLRPPGGHHRAALDRGQRDLAGGGGRPARLLRPPLGNRGENRPGGRPFRFRRASRAAAADMLKAMPAQAEYA